MFDEALLNKQYMPYVSRAKAYGGPKLLQAVGPALLTKNWRQNSLELLDALTARFGSDVAKVAAQLDIESKYALAIGDSTNDREMIEWAGLGIAMGNADQELKNAADEIAPDNVHDGAASVIERFL